ncbi:MAG: hypothetical protein ABL893_16230 [Hyphomicrobium sp.]
MKTELFDKLDDVAEALCALGPGLTVEIITQSVERGYLKRVSCDKFHPKTLPGTVHRAESISSLRHDLVVTSGWSPDCASNQELIVSPNGDVAIAVVSGDANVGNLTPGQNPSTKYDSGSLTRRAIAVNAGQLDFFATDDRPVPDGHAESRATWILLSYVASHEIRYELSLPVSYSDSNFIDKWAKRIVFPSIAIDGIRLPELPPYASQPDVDVKFKEA